MVVSPPNWPTRSPQTGKRISGWWKAANPMPWPGFPRRRKRPPRPPEPHRNNNWPRKAAPRFESVSRSTNSAAKGRAGNPSSFTGQRELVRHCRTRENEVEFSPADHICCGVDARGSTRCCWVPIRSLWPASLPPRANLLRPARAAASREHLRIAIKLWHTRCVRLAEPHTPTARRRRCPDPRSPAQMTQVREIGVENDKGENFFGVQRRLPREQSEQLRSTALSIEVSNGI